MTPDHVRADHLGALASALGTTVLELERLGALDDARRIPVVPPVALLAWGRPSVAARVLGALASTPATARDIATVTGLSRQQVQEHLHRLARRGVPIVKTRHRQGRMAYAVAA